VLKIHLTLETYVTRGQLRPLLGAASRWCHEPEGERGYEVEMVKAGERVGEMRQAKSVGVRGDVRVQIEVHRCCIVWERGQV
jgi:hypothetical protein